MATLANTSDQDVVRCEMFIAAPPDRVFQAITDPRQLSQWWGQKDLYRVTKLESDLRPHGKWISSGVSPNGETSASVANILKSIHPICSSRPGVRATWATW